MGDSSGQPPSRLDMDAEIHQAINMAHRINEKMSMDTIDEVDEEDDDQEVPDTEQGSPHSRFRNVTKTEMKCSAMFFLVLVIGSLCLSGLASHCHTFYMLRSSESMTGLIIKSVLLTLVYLLLFRSLNIN